MDWALVDETYTRCGLLKVLRAGNGYEWKVFGVDNFVRPLFSGTAGQFQDAWRTGEIKLFKDLKDIFWLLNEASSKERREGEPGDSEMVERVIREINAGRKESAINELRQIIEREKAEREPEDAQRLNAALALLVDEPIGKAAMEKAEECQRCKHPKAYHDTPNGECWGGGKETEYLCDCPKWNAPAYKSIGKDESKPEEDEKEREDAYYESSTKKDTTYEPCPTCNNKPLSVLHGSPRKTDCQSCGGTGYKITTTQKGISKKLRLVQALTKRDERHEREMGQGACESCGTKGKVYENGRCEDCDLDSRGSPKEGALSVKKYECAACGSAAATEVEPDGTRVCDECYGERNEIPSVQKFPSEPAQAGIERPESKSLEKAGGYCQKCGLSAGECRKARKQGGPCCSDCNHRAAKGLRIARALAGKKK